MNKITSDDVGNFHEVIIDHVRQMIRWESIRFDEDLIIDLHILMPDLSSNDILEFRGSIGHF